MELAWFEMSKSQREVAALGRKMMSFSERTSVDKVPVEILNEISRVGERLAEKATLKGLTDRDKKVITYVHKFDKGAIND